MSSTEKAFAIIRISELEEQVERLEKALDKACKTLVLPLPYKTAEQWKEWCLHEDD